MSFACAFKNTNVQRILLACSAAVALPLLPRCFEIVARRYSLHPHLRRRCLQVEEEMRMLAKTEYSGAYGAEMLARIAILEGFLRRLAVCEKQRQAFVLRGSIVTRQIILKSGRTRSAQDLDFLAQFPWEAAGPEGEVVGRISEILSVVVAEHDGVSLGADVHARVCFAESEMPGVKITLKGCSLWGKFHQDISIDVAFGDPLLPPASWRSYEPVPVFRPCAKERFTVLAARPELMFAWKLHGLFENNIIDELGRDVQGRWRAKDLYDLWLMARFSDELDIQQIPVAVNVAFVSRGQDPCLVERLVRQQFGTSSGSQRQWRKYRASCVNPDEIPLQLYDVVGELAAALKPVVRRLRAIKLVGIRASDGSDDDRQAEVFGKSRSKARLEALKKCDATAMIVTLPGRWDVVRFNSRVYVSSRSESESGASTPSLEWWEQFKQQVREHSVEMTVQFLPREEQYEVENVMPPRIVRKQTKWRGSGDQSNVREVESCRPGCLWLRQIPQATQKACRAQAIYRRVGDPSNLEAAPTLSNGAVAIDKTREMGCDERVADPPPQKEECGVPEPETGRLARRLEVLHPLKPMVYVTGSEAKFREAQKCLAEWKNHLAVFPGLKPAGTVELLEQMCSGASSSEKTSSVHIECLQGRLLAGLKDRKTFKEPGHMLAEQVARYCHSLLGTACFVDITFLEFTDEGPQGRRIYDLSRLHCADSLCNSSGDTALEMDILNNFVRKKAGQKATVRCYVAYCDSDGASDDLRVSPVVRVFEGALEGHITDQLRDMSSKLKLKSDVFLRRERSVVEEELWKHIFVPEGYSCVLADMDSSSFCINVRHLPFLELAQSLRGRDYSSVFEVHVTVRTPQVNENCIDLSHSEGCESLSACSKGNARSELRSDEEVDGMCAQEHVLWQWRQSCASLKHEFGHVKPVLIENASGQVPRQLMTASYHIGSFSDVQAVAFRLSQALAKQGYEITRIKIEALMSNRGVPETDVEARRLSEENYFEFHAKLKLPHDFDSEKLQSVALAHDAKMSRNPFAVDKGSGWQRRFVNMRIYGVGKATALARLDACLLALDEAGFIVERVIREYAVYDSNVALDRGWLDNNNAKG